MSERKTRIRFPGLSRGDVAELDDKTFRRVRNGDWHRLPKQVRALLRKAIEWTVDSCIEGLEESDSFKGWSEDDKEWTKNCLEACSHAGFAVAIYRYGKHLNGSREVKKMLRDAGDKGRQTNAKRKASRRAMARAMFADGREPKEIARDMSVDISTIYRYLSPGKSPKARKKRSR